MWLDGCGHGTADPSGAVLEQLKVILRAVPVGATGLQASATDASWQSGCQDGTGHAGWAPVSVTARFSTASTESMVVANINAVLVRHGWERHDVVVTPGQGPVAHWTKMVRGISRASAFAYPVPAGSTAWFVTGTWQPSPAVNDGDCA